MDIELIKLDLRTARYESFSGWRDHHGWTRLHAAIASGDHDRITYLLRLVNISNRQGWTPLHVAVGLSGDSDIRDALSNILRTLLTAGADRNARNKDGWTPMHVAAALNHAHIAEVVERLAEGAAFFPGAKDGKGRTPLHIAAAKNEYPEVINILCGKKESGINARDGEGNTPLHKASEKTKNPEIVRLMLDKCANMRLRNGKGQLPFDLAERNKKLKGTEVYWRLHEATYLPRT